MLTRISNFLKSFRRDRDGAVAVEFAFVAVPFFMLVFGVFEAGQVLMKMNQIDFHTDRAVRIAAVDPDGVSDSEIRADIIASLTRLDAGSLTVDVSRSAGSGDAPDIVSVTVTYLYEPITPLFVTDGFTLTHEAQFPLIDQSMD